MVGRTIGQYTVLEKLGEGGMGVVYKAEDTKLRRVVALKFLPAHLSGSEEDKARFFQEAQAASALNHPNVCTIHDIAEYDIRSTPDHRDAPDRSLPGKQTFIVMEYVEGQTLLKLIRSAPGQMPIASALSLASQIADALVAAHEKGIVHRDIKSENIMVSPKGQVKVMDFGLAKFKGSLKLTKTHSTVGTLGYMSPEQIQAGVVDHRSDQFSFGVVLFELLTGKLPFRGDHEAALVYSIVHEPPEAASNFRTDIPEGLIALIQRALEKDPAKRFTRTEDLQLELSRVRQSLQMRPSEGMKPPSGPAGGPPAAPAAPAAKKRTIAAMLALVLLVVAAAVWYALPGLRSVPEDHRIESIAVLPFRNASGDQSNDYLSDGITENIINALSRLKQFRVIPRSTAFHYKGKEEDAQSIGNELHVRAVLTGRVILNGDDLNIQAELIDIEHQSQLWGEQYARKKSDLLTVQDELSRAIAGQLHLTGDEGQSLIKHSTENTDAYQLYLKGRYYWDKRSVAGFTKALQYFQEALDIDPNYALAYAGMADCYDLLGLGIYNGLPPQESYPKAKAAIEKAFRLDSNLAEAYTTRAHINHSFEWDWPRAESDFRRAIELNPKYATAHVFYAVCLNALGRLEEAQEQFQLAQQLEPLSLAINTWYGMSLYYRREYDQAIRQYRKTIDIDPNFGNAHLMLGWSYTAKKMFPEALSEFRLGRQLAGDNPVMIASLVYALAFSGKTADARALLDTLVDVSKQRFVSPHNLAIAYAGLGEKEQFYHWLERAAEEHSFIVTVGVLRLDPVFDFVRMEPRFVALFKQTGLPPL